MTTADQPTKVCARCREAKPVSLFRKCKARTDGLQNYCKPCHAEANSKWRERNRQKHLQSLKEWHGRNRDWSRQSNRLWMKNNKARRRLIDQRRRTALASGGIFTVAPKDIRRLYSSACRGCGTTKEITADHIVPLSRGGRHSIGNLQPLCRQCNSSKKDKLMIEWRSLGGVGVS